MPPKGKITLDADTFNTCIGEFNTIHNLMDDMEVPRVLPDGSLLSAAQRVRLCCQFKEVLHGTLGKAAGLYPH